MNRPPRYRFLPLAALLLAPSAGLAAGADHLQTLPDFKVELVMSADKARHGSWISLGKDGKGRLLLGGQNRQPITRLTIADGKVAREEVIELPVSEVMGSLWAFDSLYLNGSANGKFGLWRLREKPDGTLSAPELLREWKGGGGEHGAHGIVLGPDGQHLYIVCGNFVSIPTDILNTSPHRNYADDVPLPRAEDGNGFGATSSLRVGSSCSSTRTARTPSCSPPASATPTTSASTPTASCSASTPTWNGTGARVVPPDPRVHAVSGGDTGFREGTAKWPEYYPDSLPAVTNIGIGSPTGVGFGTGAKFPVKYQKAFYMLDWTYGRVIAVHLTPNGAGYTGTWENFVAPKGLTEKVGKKSPNNVTDIVIGDDGALYFTTGGRNTPGNLYRVTYAGKEPTTGDPHDAAGADARKLRHELEQFHHSPDPKALEMAWPQLGSEDRYLRYAARIAVERQPVSQWKDKALAETKPQAALTALLALTRCGDSTMQAQIASSLAKLSMAQLSEAQQLEKIRVIEVNIARHGKPQLTWPRR
jgi:hypothetical protein